MMAQLIIGYVSGVLLGRHGYTVPPWLTVVSIVVGMVFLRRQPRAWPHWAVACGLVWGAAHSGLTSAPRPLKGVVSAVNAADFARGTILVKASGRVYEAIGPDAIGRSVQLMHGKYPSIFSSRLRAKAIGPPDDADGATFFAAAGRALSLRWKRAASLQPSPVAALLRSIAVGDGSLLPSQVHDDFKATGIYHLLVVSGQHVTMIGLFAAGVLALPFRFCYALRLLSPRQWRHADGGLGVASVAIAVLYAFATGMNAATQRSVVMFAAWQLLRLFCGELPPMRRLCLCLIAQIAIFPIGLLSEASLMSWTAYLLVGAASSKDPLRSVLWLQTKLCIIAAAAFGQLALFGIAINLLLVPVFTVAMLAAAMIIVAPDFWGARVGGGFLLAFQQTVSVLADVSRRYGYYSLMDSTGGLIVRGCLLMASGWIVLNTLRRLTIRPYVDG